MIIEKGDFFAVTRGFIIEGHSVAGPEFVATIVTRSRADRSHEGCVYQALEVCHPMVSCKRIWSEASELEQRMNIRAVGEILSLNTSELEIMVLSADYVRSLTCGETSV